MQFQIDDRFPAAREVVEDAMADPAYLESLDLPDISKPEVLGIETSGHVVTTRVAFQYTGSLDSVAQRVLRGTDVGWVQEVVLDRAAHRATFSVVPNSHAARLSCRGTYELAEGDGSTTRTIRGHLRVNVPLVAGRAERMISGGVVRRMRLESDFLRRWLAQNTG